MKVYISGKISGLSSTDVSRKFARAEEQLREKGHEPVNPLRNGLTEEAAWEEHMAADLLMLAGCDAVYFLPDWLFSRGATVEYYFALQTGKPFLFEKNPRMAEVARAVAQATGVQPWEFLSKTRESRIARPRMLFIRHCRRIGVRQKNIAVALGRSAMFVYNNEIRCANMLLDDREFKKLSDFVEKIMKNI